MQRVTYRRRHAYNTKSNKIRISKTPGGRNVVLYRKKKGRLILGFCLRFNFWSILTFLQFLGSIPRCGDTGVKLHGIKAARSHELKHATKRTKTVTRTYGGTLSAHAVRQRILRSFLSEEKKLADKLNKANEAKKWVENLVSIVEMLI